VIFVYYRFSVCDPVHRRIFFYNRKILAEAHHPRGQFPVIISALSHVPRFVKRSLVSKTFVFDTIR
jgi:hypothetical protein